MSIHDLMINDWVLVEGIPKQVKQINENSIFVEGSSLQYNEEYVYPISVTPDIIRNNGFILDTSGYNEGWYICKVNDDEYIEVANFANYSCKDSQWSFSYGKPDPVFGFVDFSKSEFTYVHELQHSLKIAKCNKTIIL